MTPQSIKQTQTIRDLIRRLDAAGATELEHIWQAKANALRSRDPIGLEAAEAREAEFLANFNQTTTPSGIAPFPDTAAALAALSDFIIETALDVIEDAEGTLQVLSKFMIVLTSEEKAEWSKIHGASVSEDEWIRCKAKKAQKKFFAKVCKRLGLECVSKAEELETTELDSDKLLDCAEWLTAKATDGFTVRDESLLLKFAN